MTNKSKSNVQQFRVLVRLILSLIGVHLSLQAHANSLHENKYAEFQVTFARFDSKTIGFIANEIASGSKNADGAVVKATGHSTAVAIAMHAEASAYWRDAEPRDYKTINLLYYPFCLAQVYPYDLNQLNLIDRRNAIANQIESNFQKFGNFETSDFFSIVESARVFRSNLSTLSQSLEIIPAINAQVDSLQEYISKVESTHSHLLNIISSQLTSRANISESVNSLYALKLTVSDSTEKEIIDRVISVMNELNKLPLQLDESLKQIQNDSSSKAIDNQIASYKKMVGNWQEKLQSSYDETKVTIDKLDANITYARGQMADATTAVNAGLTAINHLEAHAESIAKANFQQIDARLKEIIAAWHDYIKSSGRENHRLRQYVIEQNYVGKVMNRFGSGKFPKGTETRTGCVDYAEK